jgi:DNA-binding transcriptional LysR family regulator
MDLELLKRFYIVAQEGTLAKASERIHVVPSALTKSISDFEYQMKTQLFNRLPKGMKLTPQGERLFAFAAQFLSQAESFERVFNEKEDEIEGEIRILTTPYVGTHWLIPHMKEFLKKHPKVTLQILLNNEEIRYLGGADIGICPFISQQENLTQELLFPLTICLFASSAYLKEMGMPQKPEDLDRHHLIAYKENFYTLLQKNWILYVGRSTDLPPRKPYIQVDTLDVMVQSALHGMGIIEAPDFSSILNSGLVQIMPDVIGPQVPYYFTFSENRKKSKKITRLLSYLATKGK